MAVLLRRGDQRRARPFTAHGLDGTLYRIHAVGSGAEPVSAEPIVIQPAADSINIKLVLIRKGYSPRDGATKALENWRNGLGLP